MKADLRKRIVFWNRVFSAKQLNLLLKEVDHRLHRNPDVMPNKKILFDEIEGYRMQLTCKDLGSDFIYILASRKAKVKLLTCEAVYYNGNMQYGENPFLSTQRRILDSLNINASSRVRPTRLRRPQPDPNGFDIMVNGFDITEEEGEIDMPEAWTEQEEAQIIFSTPAMRVGFDERD